MKDDSRKESDTSSNIMPMPRSALRWYMLGFGLLGGAVGYFAGSSQSPVIGTLIPLMFGMIGGAGGLYLARLDFESSTAYFRLEILGKSLVLFILFTLLGSAYGISLRTQRNIWSFISPSIFLPKSDTALPEAVLKDPRKAMEIVLLRARIRALGASLDEEKAILQGAAKSMEQKPYEFGANGSLREEIDRVLSALYGGSRKTGISTSRGPSHQD